MEWVLLRKHPENNVKTKTAKTCDY